MTRVLCPGNMVLLGLCLLDMISTLILTLYGGIEANPVMAYFLNMGAWPFVVAKLASFIPAVIILEWYRRRNPAVGSIAIRAAVYLYLFIYILATYRVNFLSS